MSTKIICDRHTSGIHPSVRPAYASVVRSLEKIGLDRQRAILIARDAYNASKGRYWNLPVGSALRILTERTQKDAVQPEERE